MSILQSLLSYLTAHPQPLRTPTTSLHLAQQAPLFLASPDSKKDTQETWYLHETLLLAALYTRDDPTAQLHLSALSARFGADTPRVLALQGLFDEATAAGRTQLDDLLKRYEKLLRTDPTCAPIERRRVAVLRSLGRPEDAISALTRTVGHSPTDAEAWSMLAELYKEQGMYPQATFCLEEVLLIVPNAYNVHARLGEIALLAAGKEAEGLAEAVKWYCRSVELCEWYLRGLYGLVLATGRILESGKGEKLGLQKGAVEELNTKARARLQEIVDRAKRGEAGWTGFDLGEVKAADELMQQER